MNPTATRTRRQKEKCWGGGAEFKFGLSDRTLCPEVVVVCLNTNIQKLLLCINNHSVSSILWVKLSCFTLRGLLGLFWSFLRRLQLTEATHSHTYTNRHTHTLHSIAIILFCMQCWDTENVAVEMQGSGNRSICTGGCLPIASSLCAKLPHFLTAVWRSQDCMMVWMFEPLK